RIKRKPGANIKLPLVPRALQHLTLALMDNLPHLGRVNQRAHAAMTKRPCTMGTAVEQRIIFATQVKNADLMPVHRDHLTAARWNVVGARHDMTTFHTSSLLATCDPIGAAVGHRALR